MAMHVPTAPGLAQMLKEGARHFSGLEEAVFRNIAACKELSKTTKPCYGPNGMNKMVINHIEKLFITNDAATIIKELEVEHPAAKMLVLASQMQEQEAGDGTNFVLIFAGTLLEYAEDLLKMGLSVSEVIDGYKKALAKALTYMPTLAVGKAGDLRSVKEAGKYIRASVMSKQYGNEQFLAELIAQACATVMSLQGSQFNVDNIRICKIAGSGVQSSQVVKGMVFKREVEGDVQKVSECKVAVFSCPFDAMQTETKGTVLIKSAAELMNFSKGEEDLMEKQVGELSAAGVKVVVSGGKIGDIPLHFLNKYKILAVRLNSKWDVRRVCRTLGATPLPKMGTPSSQEMGQCAEVYTDEIANTPLVVFKQDNRQSAVATIIIRGPTDSVMDDIERAVDDGVNTFKGLTRDNRVVAGAGAFEMELAKLLTGYSETYPGMEQYSIEKFAASLQAMPKAIAENTGLNGTEVVAKLYAAHQDGKKNIGVDIENDEMLVVDAVEKAVILDLYLVKFWALKLAVNAACTVLQVDQIIMAKRAGGPAAPKENKDWDED